MCQDYCILDYTVITIICQLVVCKNDSSCIVFNPCAFVLDADLTCGSGGARLDALITFYWVVTVMAGLGSRKMLLLKALVDVN